MPLQSITPGLWTLEGQFKSGWMTGSTRMAVIGGEGGLVLYSPVALDEERRQEIASLGTVAAIVAPNTVHHLYLRDAAAAFPEARVFVPEGLVGKIGPVERAETISRAAPPALPEGIEHFIFERHAIRETVLFHAASRTLVTADLLYSYQAEHGAGEKAMFRLIGCYGAPKVAFYHRFAIRDRAAVRELADQVNAWSPRRIVMCHGRIIESDTAPELFEAAWKPFGA